MCLFLRPKLTIVLPPPALTAERSPKVEWLVGGALAESTSNPIVVNSELSSPWLRQIWNIELGRVDRLKQDLLWEIDQLKKWLPRQKRLDGLLRVTGNQNSTNTGSIPSLEFSLFRAKIEAGI